MTSASSLRALSFWPRSPYCDSLRKPIVMKALSCGIERLGWLFSISRNMVVPDRCAPSRKTGGFAVCSLMERLDPPPHAPAQDRLREGIAQPAPTLRPLEQTSDMDEKKRLGS